MDRVFPELVFSPLVYLYRVVDVSHAVSIKLENGRPAASWNCVSGRMLLF